MPVDATAGGDNANVILVGDGSCVIVHHDTLEEAKANGTPLHQSHFATCPNAAKHRRKKGA